MRSDALAAVSEAEGWEQEGWEVADAVIWPERVLVDLRRGGERAVALHRLDGGRWTVVARYPGWEAAILDAVRGGYADINRDIAAGRAAWVHEDIEVEVDERFYPGTGGRVVGRDAYARYQEEIREAFSDYGWDVQEVRKTGDRVLIAGRVHGRGRDSGAEASFPLWHVWTLRDRRPVLLEVHTDREAAEAAFAGP